MASGVLIYMMIWIHVKYLYFNLFWDQFISREHRHQPIHSYSLSLWIHQRKDTGRIEIQEKKEEISSGRWPFKYLTVVTSKGFKLKHINHRFAYSYFYLQSSLLFDKNNYFYNIPFKPMLWKFEYNVCCLIQL